MDCLRPRGQRPGDQEHADGGYRCSIAGTDFLMGVNILDDHDGSPAAVQSCGPHTTEESPHCQGVRRSGAAIMDLGGEEFNKTANSPARPRGG